MSSHPFEAAADAVVAGDAETLRALLRTHPTLVHDRSPRTHHATLLHYVAANGVEDERQRTPANAAGIAQLLLDAGADPDALAEMYGGRCTTLSLLVSSTPLAEARVQIALVEALVDAGASVEPVGVGAWDSPLATALAFGMRDAAETLVRRGARIDTLPKAAGLGRLDEVRRLLPATDADARHGALAVAAQLGHADVRDTIYHATPLQWAEHGRRADVAAYLRSVGEC